MPFFKENVTLTNDDGEKWYTAKTFSEWGPFYQISFDITVYKVNTKTRGIFEIKNIFWIRLESTNNTNLLKICPGLNHCITADIILDQKYQFLIQMYPKNDSIWSMIEINGSVIDHQENDESVEILQNVTLNIGQRFLTNNGILENVNVTRIDKMETKEFACSPPGKIYDIGSIFFMHLFLSTIVNVSIS